MDFEKPYRIQRTRNVFLYLAAVTIYIMSFSDGAALAWITPVLPKLQSTSENPFGVPLSVHEISWLASLLSLGGFVGTFVGGYLADSIGRKRSLISITILKIKCFVILTLGKHLYLYYLARFLLGICIGTAATILPMYLGEIAEIHNRGTICTLHAVFVVIGWLYCYSVGPYLSIQWFSSTLIILPIVFLIICIPFIPETPCYLIMRGRYEEAKLSLAKYRSRCDVEDELLDLTRTVKESLAEKGGILDIFKTKNLRRGLSVTMGLMLFRQFIGISAIIMYMHNIFDNYKSVLPKELSIIIVGIVQVLTTFLSSLVVDKLGRKPLLLISATGTFISLSILSIYFYSQANVDVTYATWVPLTSLMAYMLFFLLGMGALPVTIAAEVFPPHVKSTALSLTIATCFFFSFSVAKLFPIIVDMVNKWFAFLLFTCFNGVGITFIWLRVPETKGKTLREILELLK